jgi:hypothetical protein
MSDGSDITNVIFSVSAHLWKMMETTVNSTGTSWIPVLSNVYQNLSGNKVSLCRFIEPILDLFYISLDNTFKLRYSAIFCLNMTVPG